MSGPLLSPVLPPVAQSSNLLQYRALLQVFTYARVKRQSAEHLVRDAMTGGVVVPFSLLHSTDTAPSLAATSPQSSKQSTFTFSPSQPPPRASRATSVGAEEQHHVLLLPSSKCIGTLATLLADGFFNVAPLSSSVEKVRGASFQHRSECEARDYFTLIDLLYPDCVVAESLPRGLLALRRAEAATPHPPQSGFSATRAVSPSNSLQTSLTAPRSWKSPPTQGEAPVPWSLECESAALEPLPLLQPSAGTPSAFLADAHADLATALPPRLQSPTKSSESELLLPDTASLANMMLPEVDPVPLSFQSVVDLLECRRSVATVLLSSLNEALHDVQFRELEKSRPTTTAKKTAPSLGEEAVLQVSNELLLTAKLLLLSVMAASEVWCRRARSAYDAAAVDHLTTAPPLPSLPSPFLVLYELFAEDEATAAQFTTAPVEEWVWGRDKETLARWYDQTLDCLMQSTEAAGAHLDRFLQSSKSVATQRGEAVTHAPTLLFYRPRDGAPAVEFHLSFMDNLNSGVALPVMPVQPGEVQLLLNPCVVRTAGAGETTSVSSRGHELLFDATACPMAEFLQHCVSAAYPAAMLQGSGDDLPPHFRRHFHALSVSERAMVRAVLDDAQLFGTFLEKNAPMLARLTLWCDCQWPPRAATTHNESLDHASAEPSAAMNGDGSDGDYELAADIKESVLFRHPFNAAVGRYVREVVALKGFDQVTLERWVRHICTDIAHDGPLSAHRSALAALVKFAALQNRWTWTSEIAELQRQYLP